MDVNERRWHATEKAAEYLVQLQEGGLSRAQREQMVDWLRESPVHVAELLRVAQVHGALQHFQDWGGIASAPDAAESNVVAFQPRETAIRNRSPFSRGWIALAGSMAAIVVAVAWWILAQRAQTIETERGERRELVLADGSRLNIDPETRLRVKYAANMRDIYLDTGRALFKVAKNANRPFVVHSAGTLVRAVGTEFGVARAADAVVVTVAEGRVLVGSAGSGLDAADGNSKGGNSAPSAGRRPPANAPRVSLAAGEQVTVPQYGAALPVRKVDAAHELAWAEGRLIFDNTPISSVIEQFNYYNRVQLHVDDPSLARRQVNGVFYASDPESFLAFIQTVIPVHVVRDGHRDITLVPDGAR